jgi:hypothetical protein
MIQELVLDSTGAAAIRVLLDALNETRRLAEVLHRGSRTLRNVHGAPDQEDGILMSAKSNVLLEVMIDATREVFAILIKAHVCIQSQHPPRSALTPSLKNVVEPVKRKICSLLQTAKNRLIVEADDIVHDKGLGPVVTPEAIIIMLLDRLSQGVFDAGTVDVIDLYEKVVEDIVRWHSLP